MKRSFLGVIFALMSAAGTSVVRGADSPEGVALFEQHIRPLLVEQCYKCHSARSDKVKGQLLLDSKQGVDRAAQAGPFWWLGSRRRAG